MLWGGIAAALLVPLVVESDLYYPFSSTKGLWFMGAVQGALVAWGCLAVYGREFRPTADAVTLGLLAFLAFATLGAVCGPDPNRSFWSTYERLSGVIMHVHLFAFFLILSSFLKSDADWRRLFSMSVGVAAVVAAWGIFRNFGIDSAARAMEALGIVPGGISAISKSGSTLGNTSFLGSYLQINAFFSIWLLWTGKGWWRVLVAVALVSIASGILLNPGGRAMKASFLLGLVCIASMHVALNAERAKARKTAAILLLSSVPAAILVGAAAIFWRDSVVGALMEIRGVEERIVHCRIAAKGFFERPFLGWGLENYDLAFYRHFDPSLLVGSGRSLQQPWFDRVHNVVLDLLVTVGLPGCIAFFFVVAASVARLWRGCREDGRRGARAGIVFTAMFLSHFVQNLSVFDMISSQMLLFAVFAYASRKAADREFPPVPSKAGPAGYAKALLLLCAIGWLPFAYWNCVHVPRRVAKVVLDVAKGDDEGDILDKYILASGSARVGRHEVRIQLAESATRRIEEIEDFERDAHRFNEADYLIGELEKSAAECPSNLRVLYRLGELNAAAALRMSVKEEADGHGEMALKYADAAEQVFRKALALSPNHVLSHWGLTRALVYKAFLLDDGDLRLAALDAVERAVEIEPRLFASHDLAVEIATSLFEDRKLALEKVGRAVEINRRWKGALMKRIRQM